MTNINNLLGKKVEVTLVSNDENVRNIVKVGVLTEYNNGFITLCDSCGYQRFLENGPIYSAILRLKEAPLTLNDAINKSICFTVLFSDKRGINYSGVLVHVDSDMIGLFDGKNIRYFDLNSHDYKIINMMETAHDNAIIIPRKEDKQKKLVFKKDHVIL